MKRYTVTFLEHLVVHHPVHRGNYTPGLVVEKGQDFIDYIVNDIAPKVEPRRTQFGDIHRPLISYDEIVATPTVAAPKADKPSFASKPDPKPSDD